ncbi:MAG: XdhC family protein [Proteobacteria bacterium]|nr:XdhC family protein [Pseudomonadota bacterium]
MANIEGGIPFALVKVVETKGSVPTQTGAQMLVKSDSTFGTVGGGALEQHAIRTARDLLKQPGNAVLERVKTATLGMFCGGEVTFFIEQYNKGLQPITPSTTMKR